MTQAAIPLVGVAVWVLWACRVRLYERVFFKHGRCELVTSGPLMLTSRLGNRLLGRWRDLRLILDREKSLVKVSGGIVFVSIIVIAPIRVRGNPL